MKKTILNRYEFTQKNQVVIDVSIHSVEDLYHNFDRTAPYHRKELDQEFVDYLTECVREIEKYPFVIQITLENIPDEVLMSRVKKSLNNYYIYLKEVENRSLKLVFRRFVVLSVAGLVLLVLAILASRRLSLHPGVIAEVFAQGLTISAWVSLWEAIVSIFLDWRPHRENIQLFNRIIDSPILFRRIK